MKKGIHYWALPESMSLREKFSFARKCGYDGVELVIQTEGELRETASDLELHRIHNLAKDEGIVLPSITNTLSWKCSFTSDNKLIRDKAFDTLKRQIDIGKELEVPIVLGLPGFVTMSFGVNALHPNVDTFIANDYSPAQEVIPYDKAYERALESYMKIASYAKEVGIMVAIENTWSNFLLSPLEFRDFIDEINSSYIGCYFDIGNVLPYGVPHDWIRILGKRIKSVHIKDFKKGFYTMDGFVNLGEGNIDFLEVSKALRSINYEGWITAEVNADLNNPLLVAEVALKNMNKIFK